jgi:rhodanese-related sulfurtransferase
MPRIILIALLLIATGTTNAQFKADNVKYTTVFPEELCKTLMANQGYTLLDVRSKGEVDDTSSSESLNIGHLKNAIHIDIRQLPQRWKELLVYKDKPLFIYCSHSQRSRRASRLLADSGFTKVYNINGGLTNFDAENILSNPCGGYSIETHLPYKIISPKQLAEIKKDNPYFLLDIRSDSTFKSIVTAAGTKIQGHFDAAVNIPYSKLANSLSLLPAGKPIIVIDDFGSESPLAAKLLVEKGFKDVSILFNGMDEWIEYVINAEDKPSIKWTPGVNRYHLLSAEKFDKIMKTDQSVKLLDVRSENEFTNTTKNYWQNVGQIKNAVNIPVATITNSTVLPSSKNAPIIIYGFSNQDAVYAAADSLISMGYNNVSLLRGGIWYLRWASHNIKGKAYLNDLVINVPPENE